MNKEDILCEVFNKTWIDKGRRYYWNSIEKRNCLFSHMVWNLYNPEDEITYRNGYNIHHKDENKLNDNIENLGKISHKKHSSLHNKGKKNSMYNKKWSEERKKKQSDRMLGNKNSLGYKHSEKTKRKMSLAKIGNKNSLGSKQSEETKNKRSESIKKWWRDRKYKQLEELIYCQF